MRSRSLVAQARATGVSSHTEAPMTYFSMCIRFFPLLLSGSWALAADLPSPPLKSSDIDQTAAELLMSAKSQGGDAGKIVQQFEDHWLLLLVRSKTGEAEVHERCADEIIVRQGSIDLVVGGVMTDRRPFGTAPGEYHSAGLTGGTTYHLERGDVMDVPAGVPHWMKLATTEPVVCLVYKIK
jgi:mannose-6-phosphate isomerase-like protein (cupin superfamily)